MNNRQQRLTPSDYTTEVTFCNSKLDDWPSPIHDQMIQTENGKNAVMNGAHIDTERQHPQQLLLVKAAETTDLLSPSKQQLSVNYIPQAAVKPTASNLVISNENPWKKLNNVRYKLDGEEEINENNPSRYQHGYAQHITFV
jgi:hypothetical protein